MQDLDYAVSDTRTTCVPFMFNFHSDVVINEVSYSQQYLNKAFSYLGFRPVFKKHIEIK
jgi:hypothetical protein